MMITISENLKIIQGYYRFLYLGVFFDTLARDHDLEKYVGDVKIETGPKSSFNFGGETTKKLLQEIHKNPSKSNVFSFFIGISAFKGIFSTMRELIENSFEFREFLHQKLGDQYKEFEQVMRFVRNVFTHITTLSVSLKVDDFEKQREYLHLEYKPKIDLHFLYGEHWKERKGDKKYGVQISIDFDKLKEGQKFFSVIPLHQMFLLAELSYNLTRVYKKKL